MKQQDFNGLQRERYDGLDGLRTYAAICILMMHVKANMSFDINFYPLERLIDNMWRGVFLFMMISGFALCCGYYNKIIYNEISIVDFYKKRYKKILPFFSLLVLVDLFLSFSRDTLIEGLTDLTLVYSLLPNPNISVIGVGWTLGVIFLFYLLFPFFCFILRDKKSGVITLILSILVNYFCDIYFMKPPFVVDGYKPETNILYCGIFFVFGGITYLFNGEIQSFMRKYKPIAFALSLLYTALYFFVIVMRVISVSGFATTVMTAIMFWILLLFAISSRGKILSNPFTHFVSGLSLEIYLCHMVIFRLYEKAGIVKLCSKTTIGYIVVCLLTFVGALLFSKIAHDAIDKIRVAMRKCFKEH